MTPPPPRLGPKLNKVGRAPLGDATYQYQGSWSCGFKQDFLNFHPDNLFYPIWPIVIQWTDYWRKLYKIRSCQVCSKANWCRCLFFKQFLTTNDEHPTITIAHFEWAHHSWAKKVHIWHRLIWILTSINNFLVISGQVFLVWTSTKQGLTGFAQPINLQPSTLPLSFSKKLSLKDEESRKWIIWAVTCDFQQRDVLTCDSDEPMQPPFKLRSSKWC